jgi:hypothetical protein
MRKHAYLRLRLVLMLALLSLSLLTTRYPIFQPLDLKGLEGEEVALYYLEIQGMEEGLYLAHLGFTGEEVYISSPGSFSPGDVVSFHGTVENGVLLNQEYRIHLYPAVIYHLSAAGLVVFLFLFLRRWRFSLREMRFREV